MSDAGLRPVRMVVAAALTDSLFMPRMLLAAQRSTPPELSGLWEFPGGKVEAGESPRDGLRRELREELGAEVELGDELTGPDHADVDVHGNQVGQCWELNPHTDAGERLVLRLWWAEVAEGSKANANGTHHHELRWLEPGKWFDVGWIPADNRMVSALIDDAAARHRRAYC